METLPNVIALVLALVLSYFFYVFVRVVIDPRVHRGLKTAKNQIKASVKESKDLHSSPTEY